MKKNALIFSMLLVFVAALTAQAAITWQGEYSEFIYNVNKNGGMFYYSGSSPPYFIPYHEAKDSKSDNANDLIPGDNLGDVAEGYLVEFPGGLMRMDAMARGPEGGVFPPTVDLVVKAYASMELSNLTEQHGLSVSQEVSSFISRKFSVDTTGVYALNGELLGVINFTPFGTKDQHFYADYGLKGTINVEKLVDTGSGHAQSGGIIASITLDESLRQDSIQLQLVPYDEDNNPVYYILRGTLELNTALENFTLGVGITGDISEQNGLYQLGEQSDPLVLTASLSENPVPIPGSIILMFSGLVGLFSFRRIRDRA